jgi:saccharopine dehydrogenase (NAD+, L-lysine-forming)
VYDSVTTFSKPVIRLDSPQRLHLTAIDHLPSLLPRESSQDFGGQMLPYLLTLGSDNPVWTRAYQLYRSFEAKT